MLQGFQFKASLVYRLNDFVLKEDETPSSLHFKDSRNDDATAVLFLCCFLKPKNPHQSQNKVTNRSLLLAFKRGRGNPFYTTLQSPLHMNTLALKSCIIEGYCF